MINSLKKKKQNDMPTNDSNQNSQNTNKGTLFNF